MAAFTVSRAKHATLGAGVVDTVVLTGAKAWIAVINQSSTFPIYFTAGSNTGVSGDGQFPPDPTVAGDNTLVVPASGGMLTVTYVRWPSHVTVPTAMVKIISSVAAPYSVMAVDLP